MNESTIKPIALSEIIQNLDNYNTKGRNTWGRGITGDIEEYLGWHLDNFKESKLTQYERIKSLQEIGDSSYFESPQADRSELKSFIASKIKEISIDEVNLYLHDRSKGLISNEKAIILHICQKISELEKKRSELYAGTQKRFGQQLTPRAIEYDKTIDEINDAKVELYNSLVGD